MFTMICPNETSHVTLLLTTPNFVTNNSELLDSLNSDESHMKDTSTLKSGSLGFHQQTVLWVLTNKLRVKPHHIVSSVSTGYRIW